MPVKRSPDKNPRSNTSAARRRNSKAICSGSAACAPSWVHAPRPSRRTRPAPHSRPPPPRKRSPAEQIAADAAANALAEAADRVAELDRAITADRERQFQLVGEAATARSNASTNLAQVERLQKDYTRKLAEIEQSAARRAALAEALDGLSRADADVQGRLAEARNRIRQLQADRNELATDIGRVQESLESLRVRQGDLHGRVTVLEELERALDGLGAGVRHVLERVNSERTRIEPFGDFAASESQSALDGILGLVADLLRVPHEIAPHVELALGDAAQRFIVRFADVNSVAARFGEVPGRVGFIPYRETASRREVTGEKSYDLTLASRVECELPGLPDQLLGNVLLAESFTEAQRLHNAHPELRVVTRAGELLEPDGTLTIGPPQH